MKNKIGENTGGRGKIDLSKWLAKLPENRECVRARRKAV